MATFNTKRTDSRLITNIEGHKAYNLTPKEELITLVLSSFCNEPNFYDANKDARMVELCQQINDPEFLAKLAVYARRNLHMRSTAHLVACMLAMLDDGSGLTRKAIRKICLRADDVTNLMATYDAIYNTTNVNGGDIHRIKFPNRFLRGCRDAIESFDEYQLTKYMGKNHSWSMADAIKMTHPSWNTPLYKEIIEGTAKKPDTWDTMMSAKGNNTEGWHDLFDRHKVPYMACLRNLNNIVRTGDRQLVQRASKMIENPKLVAKSKQLPFRYLSAYKNMENNAPFYIYDALKAAIDYSIQNLDMQNKSTLIAVDMSGSMNAPLSARGSVYAYEVALLLAFCIAEINPDTTIIRFDTNAEYMPKRTHDILNNVMHTPPAGGCTNMHAPFKLAMKDNIDVERIIVLSDNEVNCCQQTVQHDLDKYRNFVGHDVWCHAWDLLGYGTAQFAGDKTNILAGWSEKMIDLINLRERGMSSLIDEIMKTEL